jgi:hypothetical protein
MSKKYGRPCGFHVLLLSELARGITQSLAARRRIESLAFFSTLDAAKPDGSEPVFAAGERLKYALAGKDSSCPVPRVLDAHLARVECDALVHLERRPDARAAGVHP